MHAHISRKGLFSVVLVEPKIPPNVGAVSRTCAVTGSPLYIVEPVTFREDHPASRRAGLDYWHHVERHMVPDWQTLRSEHAGRRFHLFTKKARRCLYELEFRPGDFLVFGSETDGLSEEILRSHPEELVRIPMLEGFRSLNLATAVAVALYEAIRQVEFAVPTSGLRRGEQP